MTILDEVLCEEYDRTLRILRAVEREQESLPKGSVQRKVIHGVECYYLVFRVGDKVKSKYIDKQNVEDYKRQVELRRENVKRIKELNATIKRLEKVLGKETLNEYTAKGVY